MHSCMPWCNNFRCRPIRALHHDYDRSICGWRPHSMPRSDHLPPSLSALGDVWPWECVGLLLVNSQRPLSRSVEIFSCSLTLWREYRKTHWIESFNLRVGIIVVENRCHSIQALKDNTTTEGVHNSILEFWRLQMASKIVGVDKFKMGALCISASLGLKLWGNAVEQVVEDEEDARLTANRRTHDIWRRDCIECPSPRTTEVGQSCRDGRCELSVNVVAFNFSLTLSSDLDKFIPKDTIMNQRLFDRFYADIHTQREIVEPWWRNCRSKCFKVVWSKKYDLSSLSRNEDGRKHLLSSVERRTRSCREKKVGWYLSSWELFTFADFLPLSCKVKSSLVKVRLWCYERLENFTFPCQPSKSS